MNLMISGSIDDRLIEKVVRISRPKKTTQLHEQAYRLEDVNDDPFVRQQVSLLTDYARVDTAYIEADRLLSSFKLLVIDMDSTLITIECIDEIANFAGKGAEVAAITELTMRGEIPNFQESLRRRVALLKNCPSTVLETVYTERLRLTEGAEELIRLAKGSNLLTAVLSGGFDFFTTRLQALLNFDFVASNHLEIRHGVLTGELKGAVIDAEAKARALSNIMNNYNISRAQVISIGDGANDLKMMAETDFSVAFHAKQIVADAAAFRVNYGSLSTIIDWLVP